MPTKAQIEKALIESLEHWDENVEDFPVDGSGNEKERWFDINCGGFSCALCDLPNGEEPCDYCPLNDADVACCKEWDVAHGLAYDGGLKFNHIKAVRDRIKRECEARGQP